MRPELCRAPKRVPSRNALTAAGADSAQDLRVASFLRGFEPVIRWNPLNRIGEIADRIVEITLHTRWGKSFEVDRAADATGQGQGG